MRKIRDFINFNDIDREFISVARSYFVEAKQMYRSEETRGLFGSRAGRIKVHRRDTNGNLAFRRIKRQSQLSRSLQKISLSKFLLAIVSCRKTQITLLIS